RRHGFRTINVVRRREQAEELMRLGGDGVICTADESILSRVQAITNGAGVPFALDAVGGATGTEVVQALGADGRLLVYGTLSMEPLAVHPRVLIAGHKHIEGFWLSEWSNKQNVLTMLGLFRRVGRLLREGVLTTEMGATFPMDQVQAAVRQAAQPG